MVLYCLLFKFLFPKFTKHPLLHHLLSLFGTIPQTSNFFLVLSHFTYSSIYKANLYVNQPTLIDSHKGILIMHQKIPSRSKELTAVEFAYAFSLYRDIL